MSMQAKVLPIDYQVASHTSGQERLGERGVTLTCMPGIAFHSLLYEAIKVSLAAMPPKVGCIGENTRPAPLIALVTPALNHSAQAQRDENRTVSLPGLTPVTPRIDAFHFPGLTPVIAQQAQSCTEPWMHPAQLPEANLQKAHSARSSSVRPSI